MRLLGLVAVCVGCSASSSLDCLEELEGTLVDKADLSDEWEHVAELIDAEPPLMVGSQTSPVRLRWDVDEDFLFLRDTAGDVVLAFQIEQHLSVRHDGGVACVIDPELDTQRWFERDFALVDWTTDLVGNRSTAPVSAYEWETIRPREPMGATFADDEAGFLHEVSARVQYYAKACETCMSDTVWVEHSFTRID